MLGIDILRCPHDRLSNCHTEEVLPADSLLVRILECFLRDHANRASAGLYFFKYGVIAQTRRHRLPVYVVTNQFLGVLVPGGLVFLAIAIFGVGLQMQEVGTDRTVTVLESGENDAVLHLRHLGTHENRQRISGRAAPWCIPGTSHALANRTRFVDV